MRNKRRQVIELSSYLEKRIAGTAEDADKAVSEYNEIGKVVTVGDGIARVYGLNNVQAGEVSRFCWCKLNVEGILPIAKNIGTTTIAMCYLVGDGRIPWPSSRLMLSIYRRIHQLSLGCRCLHGGCTWRKRDIVFVCCLHHAVPVLVRMALKYSK